MAISFPAGVEGLVHNVSPGVSFVYRGGAWIPAPLKTALPKNYIVNPTFQISQQNPGGVQVWGGYPPDYPADQWRVDNGLASPYRADSAIYFNSLSMNFLYGPP